jgi:hypothetical protein
MAFTIPAQAVLHRVCSQFSIFKHPLSAGYTNVSIDHANILDLSDITGVSGETKIIPNNESFGPIQVESITASHVFFKLPYEWEDGSPILYPLKLTEAAKLCTNNALSGTKFRIIKEAAWLRIVSETAFQLKEFAALQVKENARVFDELNATDHGMLFMLKRSSRTEYRVYYDDGTHKEWLGQTVAANEWQYSAVTETGLRLSTAACAILFQTKSFQADRDAPKQIREYSYSNFVESSALFQAEHLEIALKCFKTFDIGIQSDTVNHTNFLKINDRYLQFNEATPPKFGWNYHGENIKFVINISKHRNKYTATVGVKLKHSAVLWCQAQTFNSIQQLHDDISKWCESHNFNVVGREVNDVLRPAYWENLYSRWE